MGQVNEKDYKFRYVNGLTGTQIRKVIDFTLGEHPIKWGWDEVKKEFVYYVRDSVYDDESLKKHIAFFEKYWRVQLKPLRDWEG
jgi:hypothetical protein